MNRKAPVVATKINGVLVHLDAPFKRPRPETCEICGRPTAYLGYHHWDDNEPSVGLWLCPPCHQFAEGVDKGLLSIYMFLREQAEKEVKWAQTLSGEELRPRKLVDTMYYGREKDGTRKKMDFFKFADDKSG